MNYTNDETMKDSFGDKLSFIQQAYDLNQYEIVVKECCGLFEVVFRKIFAEAVAKLPYSERNILIEKEKEIGNSKKGVQEFGLGQLVGLFRESDLMKKWAKYSGRDVGLIDTLNFNSIVDLRNRLVHESAVCSRIEAELVYNYLKNLLASYGFINLEKSIATSFEKKEGSGRVKTAGDKQGDNYARIKLNEERGIIINEADGSRNISFKVDTINSMLEAMYTSIANISNEEQAKQTLFDIGYQGGKRFGEAMNHKWEMEEISYHTKISKWCEFDSVVGWGRFINDLTIDTEEGVIDGHFKISESFLCCNRKKKDVRLCDFIIGYSTGVLEELLNGIPIKLVCSSGVCPLDNPFKKECSFRIEVQ